MILKSFFIYGGCVSRDIFSSEYNQGELLLAHYAARTSLVKLQSASCNLAIDVEKVPSAFQRRLLKDDSENNLLKSFSEYKYDHILMDLMFIRYSLVLHENAWLTYSPELKRAGIIDDEAKILTMKDQEYWNMFEKGVQCFFSYLSEKQLLEKVLLNKLYLATEDSLGEKFPNYIVTQNNYLDKAYNIVEKYLKPSQIITYDLNLFVAEPKHKWGRSPMHYTSDFYSESYRKLISI